MVDYDQDELGIAAARGNAGVMVIICIILSAIQVVRYAKLRSLYANVQRRMVIILISPAWFSLCALFGLYWAHPLVALFIEIYKAVLISVFTNYLFAFIAATAHDNQLVYDHDTLVKNIMSIAKTTHAACFRCFGTIDLDTKEKSERFLRRIRICVRQYMLLMPAFIIVRVSLRFSDYDAFETAVLPLDIIQTICTVIAMYHMKLTTDTMKKIISMRPYGLQVKGICVQFGILLPQLQNLFIGIFASQGLIADTDDYTVEENTDFTFYQLFACEMVVLAFAFVLVFKPSELIQLHNKHVKGEEISTVQLTPNVNMDEESKSKEQNFIKNEKCITNNMVDYDQDELGIAAARGNTAFMVFICVVCSLIQFLAHLRLKTLYARIQCRMFIIVLAPAWFSICALFGLFFANPLVALFIDLYKAILIPVFVNYLGSMLAAVPSGDILKWDDDQLVKGFGKIKRAYHVACFRKCFGSVDLSTDAKTAKFIMRLKICIRQFVFTLPVLVIIAAILWYIDQDTYDQAIQPIEILKTLVTLIAMYHFKLASDSVATIEEYAFFKVKIKAITVQLGILVPQLQLLFIGIFANNGMIASTDNYSVQEMADFTYYQLLACEMVVLAFMLILVFPTSDLVRLHSKLMDEGSEMEKKSLTPQEAAVQPEESDDKDKQIFKVKMEGVLECSQTWRTIRRGIAVFYAFFCLYEALLWGPKTLMYLTKWNLWSTTLYFVLVAIEMKNTRITTVLLEIGWVGQLMIPLLYWPLIWPYTDDAEKEHIIPDFLQHGALGILLVLDLLSSNALFIVKDLLYIYTYSITYTIWFFAVTWIRQIEIYPGMSFNLYTILLIITAQIVNSGVFGIGYAISKYKENKRMIKNK